MREIKREIATSAKGGLAMTDESGQIIVFAAMFLPAMMAIFALVVNLAVFFKSKALLQGAADKAAYAGATVLSDKMNEIAEINNEIGRTYRELEKRAATNSTDTQDYKNDHEKARATIADLLDDIDVINKQAFGEARAEAEKVFAANIPTLGDVRFEASGPLPMIASLTPVYGTEEEISRHWIGGGSGIFDPADYNIWRPSAPLVKYVKKAEPEDTIMFSAMATALAPVFLRLKGLPKGLAIGAASIAQPFGSSIEAHGLVDDKASLPKYRAAEVYGYEN